MSRSQKVNESETMSTASAYLYKEQAECVQQVHQYLVEHLDSRVTQAELAQRYHISLTSLKGAFKQVYGLPINTYLRRCRVQHAEQLLFTTDLSILEIAQRVGYDSPSRFAAMFKREKGITPRECRRVRTDQLPEEKTIAWCGITAQQNAQQRWAETGQNGGTWNIEFSKIKPDGTFFIQNALVKSVKYVILANKDFCKELIL